MKEGTARKEAFRRFCRHALDAIDNAAELLDENSQSELEFLFELRRVQVSLSNVREKA